MKINRMNFVFIYQLGRSLHTMYGISMLPNFLGYLYTCFKLILMVHSLFYVQFISANFGPHVYCTHLSFSVPLRMVKLPYLIMTSVSFINSFPYRNIFVQCIICFCIIFRFIVFFPIRNTFQIIKRRNFYQNCSLFSRDCL